MKRWYFLFLLFFGGSSNAQTVKEKLTRATQQMETDPQFRHAIIGLCIADSKTGKIVYEHNAQAGLAPASTQKIFTSCAAFDLLGKDFRYTTEIGYNQPRSDTLLGYFIIKPSGDPSFGSYRFMATKPDLIMNAVITSLKQKKITPGSAYRVLDDRFSMNAIPGGWVWEDIGNYYGAAACSFNWLENQYDIILRSGKDTGAYASIVQTKPAEAGRNLTGFVKTAAKGSGDNTIVYINYGFAPALIEGTIPVNEDAFVVGAAIADPPDIFIQQLRNKITAAGIEISKAFSNPSVLTREPDSLFNYVVLYKHISPPLDSLCFWFLQKSINLYGEAFIKTMALQKSGFASTEKGVELLKNFWSERGIEKSALAVCDGSGLSPQNRVTADALVKALQYAETRPWFSSFYYDLPEHNGMKMKSGVIGGARAYAGYQQAKDGKRYSFAIIVNNFDGPAADVVNKMYRLLDNLK